MELSQFTDYSLRSLIFVGTKEGLASVGEIARAYGISQNHLVKVIHRLGKLGYLRTYRGRAGGIALAKAPEEISVGALVRETEPCHLAECLQTDGGNCLIDGSCVLKHVLVKARRAFFAELDQYTLADLMAPRADLQKRFAVAG